jgi:hypothetical protein
VVGGPSAWRGDVRPLVRASIASTGCRKSRYAVNSATPVRSLADKIKANIFTMHDHLAGISELLCESYLMCGEFPVEVPDR